MSSCAATRAGKLDPGKAGLLTSIASLTAAPALAHLNHPLSL